jgi:hypothetical protein
VEAATGHVPILSPKEEKVWNWSKNILTLHKHFQASIYYILLFTKSLRQLHIYKQKNLQEVTKHFQAHFSHFYGKCLKQISPVKQKRKKCAILQRSDQPIYRFWFWPPGGHQGHSKANQDGVYGTDARSLGTQVTECQEKPQQGGWQWGWSKTVAKQQPQ